MTRVVVIGVVVAAAVLLLVLGFIRTRRLQERHALIWIVGTLVIVLLGAVPGLLGPVAHLVGIIYAPTALFLVLVAFLGIALLDATMSVSKLTHQVRTLGQRVAILDEELRRLRAARSTEGGTAAGPAPATPPTEAPSSASSKR